MKLYAIKTNDQYIRINTLENKYEIVGMDKASVYPPDKLPQLKEHLENARNLGLENIRIVEMVITEKDFI